MSFGVLACNEYCKLLAKTGRRAWRLPVLFVLAGLVSGTASSEEPEVDRHTASDAIQMGIDTDMAASGFSGHGIPATVVVPAGHFIAGSDTGEREAAYRLDEQAYGHDRTRQAGWYDSEHRRQSYSIDEFEIMMTPVTNALYARFVAGTGYRVPDVDRDTWKSYGLVHPFARTRRHAWTGRTPPSDREYHPVVLVARPDAEAYADWLSEQTGDSWRLTTSLEWEKAARGTDGRRFPWGDTFDPALLNNADAGPFDTMPVGSYPDGASPFGMLDAAGQVYEWTATDGNPGRGVVKGGSWDDKGCGVCRPAARHARPVDLKHILIGFRLIREVN